MSKWDDTESGQIYHNMGKMGSLPDRIKLNGGMGLTPDYLGVPCRKQFPTRITPLDASA